MIKDKKDVIRQLKKDIRQLEEQYYLTESESIYEYILVLSNKLDRILYGSNG